MTKPTGRVDHLRLIGNYWNTVAQEYQDSHPEHFDSTLHPSWGLWHIPEKEISLVAGDLKSGCRMLDLGCGSGHDATGFAELGANVIAVDLSTKQLRRAISHPNVDYVVAAAERLPVPADSIDVAISDHGAFDHSPAELLLPEMNRVLRKNAALVVCTYSPLALTCYNRATGKLSRELLNDYPSDRHQFDGKLVLSERSYAGWIRDFCRFGFAVERLEELRVGSNARPFFDELVDVEWAARWPADIAWVVRKRH